MFPQVLCCGWGDCCVDGSEATCPCRIRWAVTEEPFPTAPGLCEGFVLTLWPTLFSTPWEKCQWSVNFQPFHYVETQDENVMVMLFKLKLFFSTPGAEFEIFWGGISEVSHIPSGDLVENLCRLGKLQRLWSEICVCWDNNILLIPILIQRAVFHWFREMAE